MQGLPHLHGWKWYTWAREFFESRNKQNFLCAANQISKSSTQIRKCIHWATASELWSELLSHCPTQFWYLYPAQEVVNIEFELKWKWKQFLPQGDYKNNPVYGWKAVGQGIGTKENNLGIRAPVGKVWFWTFDIYEYIPSGIEVDPTGALCGSIRAIRGGSYAHDMRMLRSAVRLNHDPDKRFVCVGGRSVRTIDP